jgi:cytoskeleton protein RodZ
VSEAALTVGETVTRARTAAGMTVAQVAAQTRIRSTVIAAIEADDFRLCGGDVYARGHLKSIATVIGTDPAALAARFDEQCGAARVTAEPVAPIAQPTQVTQSGGGDHGLSALAGTLGASLSGGRRGANWTAVMALALAVIVGVGLISFLQRPSSSAPLATGPSPSPTTSTAPGGTPSSTPTATPSSPTTPSASPNDVVAAADGVTVTVAVTGRASWMRITNGSGKTLFEGTLTKGETRTVRDKTKVKLLIGNAGAVTLNVNGRDLGAPGSGGQVVKVEFGPGDPTLSAA